MSPDPFDAREVLEHARWARRVAQAMVKDQHLAEDLAQDALEAGLRASGPPARSWRAWLHGTLQNLRRKEVRGRSRRELRELRRIPAQTEEAPEEFLEKLEAQKEVADAVLRLPEPFRTALMLRYYDELSLLELAQAQGIHPKAAESRIYRGLQLLREDFARRHGGNWVSALAALLQPTSIPVSTALTSATLMTTKSKLLIAGVGALIVLTGYLGIQSLASEVPGKRSSPQSAAHSDREDLRLEPVRPVAVATESSSLGSSSDRASIAEGMRLRIVDEAGQPVSGAEVQRRVLAWTESPPNLSAFSGTIESQWGYQEPEDVQWSDQHGEVRFSSRTERAHDVLFVRADGFVWQGFMVPFAADPVRDLGEVVLQRGGQLACRLRDEQGRPIAGMRVRFQADDRQGPAGVQTWQVIRTDAEGVAAFRSLPLVSGKLSTRPAGFLPWTGTSITVSASPTEPIEVVLARGGTSRVRVVDVEGGPVARAEIHLFPTDDRPAAGPLTRNHPSFYAETNADGVLSLSGLEDEQTHRVLARAGFAWADAKVRARDEEVVIAIPETHELRARFLGVDGQPLTGGLLMLIDVAEPIFPPDVMEPLGATGEFSMRLPAGRFGLSLRTEDHDFELDDVIALDQDRDLGDLRLQAGCRLRLDLTDAETKEPVRQVRIQPARLVQSAFISSDERWRLEWSRLPWPPNRFRGLAGAWESDFLPAGEHRLTITAEGYLPKTVDVVLANDQPNDYAFALMPSTHLVLMVRNADGTPAGGERLEIVPADYVPMEHLRIPNYDGSRQPRTRQSDAKGTLRFDGLTPGSWKVGFAHRSVLGLELARLEVKPGGNQTELILPRPFDVQVFVTANGQPLAAAEVRFCRSLDSGSLISYQDGYETSGQVFTTDTLGRIDFACKEPGNYRVDVTATGLPPMRQTLNLESTDRTLRFEAKGSSVSGRVTGGAAHAEVVVLRRVEGDPNGEKWREEWMQQLHQRSYRWLPPMTGGRQVFGTELDDDGRFVLRSVPPGTYWIVARAEGWVTTEPQAFEVGESDLTELQLRLEEAGSVLVSMSGVTAFRASHPDQKILLRFLMNGTTHVARPQSMERDGDGLLEGLPSGHGTLVIILYDDRERRTLRRIEFPLAPIGGEQLRFEWDAGQLMDPDDPK